jgi:hypothetical protein
VAEFVIAIGSSNRFEHFTFFAARFQNWLYWFEIVAALLPQLFWFPAMRRIPLAVLCISLGCISPRLYEDGVMAITQAFRPA